MDSHIFAKKWLERQGLFDKDSDYEGELGQATLEVIDFITKQGHTGGSMFGLINLLNAFYAAYNNPVDSIWTEYWHSDEGKAVVKDFTGKAEITDADIDQMMNNLKKSHDS